MNMIRAIPALPVRDITAAVEFYCDRLGFEARYVEAGFARLYRSGVEIQLWQSSDESWKERPGTTPMNAVVSGAESFLAGTASCRIEVTGIDELYTEYREKGVLHHAHPEIRKEWWGDRDFHVLDLERNLITFFERGPE